MISINEYNVLDYMLEAKKELNDWLEIYKFLKEEVNKSDNHNSIRSNFMSIFIFHLIESKIPIEQFKKTIEGAFNLEPNNVFNFARFFKRNTDLSLQKFVKNNREGEFWDQIGFCFLDYNNKKVCLRNGKYLKIILESFTEKNVCELYKAQFQSFVMNWFSTNVKEIRPIVEAGINNLALQRREYKLNDSLFGNLIDIMATNAYEVTEEKIKSEFDFLKSIIPNFEEVLSACIVNDLVENKDEFNLNLPIINLLVIVNEDFIKIIDNKFIEKYLEYKQKPCKLNLPFEKSFEANKLLSEVHSVFSICFEKRPINLSVNIDINKNLFENWVYLKVLDIKIKQGYTFENMSREQLYYLSKIITDTEKDNLIRDPKDYNFNKIDSFIDIKKWKSILDFRFLDDSIPLNKGKKGLKV